MSDETPLDDLTPQQRAFAEMRVDTLTHAMEVSCAP